MSSKIVLVGNAEPGRDYSGLINDTQSVIRFNKVPYLRTGLVGSRTDILVAQNMEADWLCGRLPRLGQGQTWILAENPHSDKTVQIVSANALDLTRVRTIYSDHFPELAQLKIKGVTSGFAALLVVLADDPHWRHEIVLCCFTWQGWKGHAWDVERAFCHGLQAAGRIKICS